MDTIAALSSGAVPSGVAVIRVSGPRAKAAVEALTGRAPPKPGKVSLRVFRKGGEPLDKGLLVWFASPKSFTGEDVAEFQTHGGRAVVDGVLAALSEIEGVRFAEAGEFSKQAFLNGRLDLTEVEGLADLVNAETSLQRRQALAQMSGALAELYESWRGRLIRALGFVEAEIDFSDEDLPDGLTGETVPVISKLIEEVRGHLEGAHLGERLRDGFRVAIYGAPNVGKSSLLNRLAERDVAIVSEQPGTTRDFLEVHLNLGGVPVTVVDTAGLRSAEDEIERIGVARGLVQASEADLRLLVMEAGAGDPVDLYETARPHVVALNKSDLMAGSPPATQKELADLPSFLISAKEGTGIGDLLDFISKRFRERVEAAPAVVPTRIRHREILTRYEFALQRALKVVDKESPDLLAEELRQAMWALGEITGRAGVEDMLDVVFKDFCIGK